jgi:hypothetical protein
VYCGKATDLQHDHLNATIIDNQPSGFFAEPANLVPACNSCNMGRRNCPWKPWLRKKCADRGDNEQAIERRMAVMRRFEQRYKAERLQCRSSGEEQRWAEYDHIRQEINRLLTAAQTIADGLRAAVTSDYEESRKSLES